MLIECGMYGKQLSFESLVDVKYDFFCIIEYKVCMKR